MFCPECGSEATADSLFCPECGAPLSDQALGKIETPRKTKRMTAVVVAVAVAVIIGLVLVFGTKTPTLASYFPENIAVYFEIDGAVLLKQSNGHAWANAIKTFFSELDTKEVRKLLRGMTSSASADELLKLKLSETDVTRLLASQFALGLRDDDEEEWAVAIKVASPDLAERVFGAIRQDDLDRWSMIEVDGWIIWSLKKDNSLSRFPDEREELVVAVRNDLWFIGSASDSIDEMRRLKNREGRSLAETDEFMDVMSQSQTANAVRGFFNGRHLRNGQNDLLGTATMNLVEGGAQIKGLGIGDESVLHELEQEIKGGMDYTAEPEFRLLGVDVNVNTEMNSERLEFKIELLGSPGAIFSMLGYPLRNMFEDAVNEGYR